MFRKTDNVIIALTCFFLGIFLVSQFGSSREYNKIIQPENNSVLALEVARLTRSNAELRQETSRLTSDLDTYKNTSINNQTIYEKYLNDNLLYDNVNGDVEAKGQGVNVKVYGALSTPQIVDLVNAIKNIGSELISINGERVTLRTSLYNFSGMKFYDINVLGNSKLLNDAMNRKGGIIEQITTKDIRITVEEKESISLPKGDSGQLFYAKVLEN
jgi:uncharacterized protein YlxW (UPF0749 family)